MAEATKKKRSKGPIAQVVDVISGFGVACACLLLLGVLTWLGTLEQASNTLLEVTRKYFSYHTFFVQPELNGRNLPILLPNGFWVGLVFFFNLLLGTVLRVRKGWKQVGILISHSGMLLLLVGAFVTQVWSKRGNMAISEGEVGDVAQHYYDHVIEVAEVEDDQVAKVHVIDTQFLSDLDAEDTRLFRMKALPFDVKVSSYHTNARPFAESEVNPEPGEEVVDGFILRGREEDQKAAERNMAGCLAQIVTKNGEEGEKVLLTTAGFHPATVRFEDKIYTLQIRKALWKMPFEVKLNKFTHEFHPGTMRPKRFESRIERLEEGGNTPVLIKMNNPMRHNGYTFFQASWGPQGDPNATEYFSVFEVVKNPADHWPLVSLIITGVGLGIHFLMMLGLFISKQFTSNAGKKQ